MQTKHRGFVIALSCSQLLLILTTSCSTRNSLRNEIEHSVRAWYPPRAHVPIREPTDPDPIADAQIVGLAGHGEASQAADAFVQDALANNPGIQAAIAFARAKLERVVQVTALPDPVIRATVRPEPIQTAAGDTYLSLAVSQTFPVLAKLERAGNIAAAESRIALEQLNAKRVQLVSDVERAYWQIYRLDRFLEITRENRRVLENLEGVVQTQYEVGKVAQQDLLRVHTEIAKLRDDENAFGLRRSTAVAALNRLCSQPASRAVPETGHFKSLEVAADVEWLIKFAADHNPTLAALRRRIDRDSEQLELANLGYWPDVTLGFEWNYLEGREPFIPPINPMTGKRPPYSRKSEAGDDNWAIMLQLNVPIWSQRIEAAKREARQRLLATQSETHDTKNAIALRIFESWSRVDSLQHTLRVLETELIPQSQQTYEVTLAAYQAGETDFVTLIDNWRRWLDFELMRHRETVELETAFSDLQREVGMQLVRGEGALASVGEQP